jgi:hypothetical protein
VLQGRRARLVVFATAVLVVAVGTASAIPLLLSPSAYPKEARPGARIELTEQGIRFSFRVPPINGWAIYSSISTRKSPAGLISLNQSIVGPQNAEAIIYWTSFPDGDYADPCARLLGRSVGPSAADLAAAVSTAPGTKLLKGPSNVTVGGRAAKHVVLTVRENVGCDPGFFFAWKDIDRGPNWMTTEAGSTVWVWVVSVDGKRLFIAAATSDQANSGLKKEIQQIVASIRFD